MTRPSRRPRRSPAALLAVASLALLVACAPEPGLSGQASTTGSPGAAGTRSPSASVSPTPTPTAEASPEMPTDCREILSDAVLSQLGTTPLNDPAAGVETGVQADGSLVCLWRDVRADSAGVHTSISRMAEQQASDMLAALVADHGFSCSTPAGGTRCEKSWESAQYPVTNGRTLFYRAGLLIDTQYSGLAPAGYTDSIVDHLFS